MAIMIATFDYYLFSNDAQFMKSRWSQYKMAMDFLVSKIDDSGLLNVTGTSGWGRSAPAGGYSTLGNMLMYGVLQSGSTMARWFEEPNLSKQWAAAAADLKDAINLSKYNWDSDAG